jgi:hypothetical protein
VCVCVCVGVCTRAHVQKFMSSSIAWGCAQVVFALESRAFTKLDPTQLKGETCHAADY